jgi:hypothetical protein
LNGLNGFNVGFWLRKAHGAFFAAGSGGATLCRCDAFQKQRSLDVVDEIRRSDFHWSCRSVVSKRSNKGPMAPAFVSFSRNSQIVRASGMRSDNLSLRKRMNDKRSLIRNSARSSERLFVV